VAQEQGEQAAEREIGLQHRDRPGGFGREHPEMVSPGCGASGSRTLTVPKRNISMAIH
jgi:hypothetical protein